MTTDPGAPAATTAGAPAQEPPAHRLRKLRRSRGDRVLTGVCGGLGEATGVDPVVYRVLIVVLSFFGFAGLLVYGACWLLMPEADRETSLAQEALARRAGRSEKSRIILAVALSLAALVALGAVSHNNLGALLAVLFAVAVFLLIRRQDGAAGTVAAPAAPAAAPPPAWTLTKADPARTVPGAQAPAPAPAPPGAPRERSFLGRGVFGLVLVGLGVLAAADGAGLDVPAAAYPALVLALSGLGLLVATRYGRARGLIALGVLATLALPPTALVDSFDGDWAGRDRFFQPLDAAGIASGYDFGAGRVHLDLSRVDFTGHTVETAVELGAGEVVVTVPRAVDARVVLDLGVGDAQVFDVHDSGLGVGEDVTDAGPDGSGGGELKLRIDQGVGRVEVRRAAA